MSDEDLINSNKRIADLEKKLDLAEKEIKNYENIIHKYSTVINNSPIAIWMLDLNGLFLIFEGGDTDLLDLQNNNVIGQKIDNVFRDYPELINCHKNAIKGELREFLLKVENNNSNSSSTQSIYFDIISKPIYENNTIIGSVVAALNTSELRITEDKKFENMERYRTLIDQSPMAIMLMHQGILEYANSAYYNLFGYEIESELKGISTTIFLAPSVRDKLQERTEKREIGSNEPENYETIGLRKDGTEFAMQVLARKVIYDGKPAVLTYFLDIDEQKKLETEKQLLQSQLLQSQKLESLGTLSSGISHDLNNLLVGIMGNASLLALELEPHSEALNLLTEIQKISKEATNLIKQILQYTGKASLIKTKCNLNDIIRDMDKLFKVSINKSITLKYNLHQDIDMIKADKSQLQQIMLNLAINSSESIGIKNGVISIFTGNQLVDENYISEIKHGFKLIPGEYVYFEISDNGTGISEEIIQKIFDPFFSTKFTGRGLGLAVVMGIINSHRGAVKLYSEKNKGTSFKVLFPKDNSSEDNKIHVKQNLDDIIPSGKVLFVDDDATIRKVGGKMLEYLNFEPILAADGLEVLEKLNTIDNIILVILDLTMPVMSGRETLSKLRLFFPGLPVIISSGYNETMVIDEFRGKSNIEFLQKPYSLDKFKEIIKKIL